MLPEVKANYLARAIGCSFGDVESSGNIQIAVQCEVADGEYAGERIAWLGTFAPGKATEIALRALKESFGWKGDDISELADIDADGALQLLPDIVELVCDMEEYQGEWRLKAKWANKPGGSRFSFKQPLSGDRLKAFAAQMRGTIHGMSGGRSSNGRPPAKPSGGQAKQPAAARHPNAPAGIDDDVPF